jgi:hypothetical protein
MTVSTHDMDYFALRKGKSLINILNAVSCIKYLPMSGVAVFDQEYLLVPSKAIEIGGWLSVKVFKAIPHCHFTFSIPKILRRYFLFE